MLESVLERWRLRHALTRAEVDVLARASRGTPRQEIHRARGVTRRKAKEQVRLLLAKTGDDSLDAAVKRLLREVVDELRRR